MRVLYRSIAAVLLIGGIGIAVVGCGQPAPPDARLKHIRTTVPDLSGLPLKNAEMALSLVALKIGEVELEETKDSSLHRKVFGQDPAPGTQAQGGTAVNVKVYRFVGKKKEVSPGESK